MGEIEEEVKIIIVLCHFYNACIKLFRIYFLKTIFYILKKIVSCIM